jgi:hypothetical protein
VTSWPPRGNGIGSSNGRFQPRGDFVIPSFRIRCDADHALKDSGHKVAAQARQPETNLSLIFSGFAAHRGLTRQRALRATKYRDSDMREKTIPWTPEEDEIGRRLLEEHASEAEFLEKLGRTKEVARKHFYYVEHRAMVLRRRGEVPVRREPTRQVTIANAPSIAMMDDAQHQLVAPRSLTSEFFGDPPPGRSALDRK